MCYRRFSISKASIFTMHFVYFSTCEPEMCPWCALHKSLSGHSPTVLSETSGCHLFTLTIVSHADFTVSGRSEAAMYEVSRRRLYRRRMAKPQDINGMGSSR